jgi:hypothetical protein
MQISCSALNRHDAWATHALAHVFEMTGKQDEGIEFMSKTEKEWNVRIVCIIK